MSNNYENNVVKTENNQIMNQSKSEIEKKQKKIVKRTNLQKKKTIDEFCDVF